jgi:hypothetical protein
MTSTRNALCGLLVIAGALLALGCADREHIRDDYGQRVREFQSKQRVYAHAASGGPTGLDSEESSAIHKSYRTGLGGKAAATPRDNRVLILGEAPNAGSK